MTLKELRKQSGKTAAEVAAALGVTVSAVSNYEKGIRSIDVVQAYNLCNLYGVEFDEFAEAYLNTRQFVQ